MVLFNNSVARLPCKDSDQSIGDSNFPIPLSTIFFPLLTTFLPLVFDSSVLRRASNCVRVAFSLLITKFVLSLSLRVFLFLFLTSLQVIFHFFIKYLRISLFLVERSSLSLFTFQSLTSGSIHSSIIDETNQNIPPNQKDISI